MSPTLARRLRLPDAVAIGLGSMIGAGVFVVFAPASEAAGAWLLAGLVIAAFVAYCNATSSAQLAAVHPVAGGTYAYGRAELGAWWGYVAGWGFVIGKTASAAAMALTFAAYVAPGWEKPLAAAAVAALAGLNLLGVTRTALATKIIVVLVLGVLAVVALAGVAAGPAVPPADPGVPVGVYGVLQSAGLLFFAFAGYARIATMGEEVVDPARTIPRAIVIALAGAVAVYVVIAVAVLVALGPAGAAGSAAPLADVVAAAGWNAAGPVVRAGAALASLGALLALLAGLGRTSLAMAREGDLPRTLAAVSRARRVPHHAEIAIAAAVIAVVLVADVRGAIGFSSFGVLMYYFVANAAAHRQGLAVRRYPRALQVAGAIGCVVLVATLPWQSIAIGLSVTAIGVALRAARLVAERRAL
ncbi:APC family permease [Microbacterium excoecariae]|uniref:APC family permease n=1 Tax=Microbacterium excoecariae TaxID=2715210 RepID=UPI00140BC0BE|nr:APC family permease [Microbacterium excoecariae]NHI17355.1 amino acid permease [Microbacterium excoecariae]